MSSSDKDKDGGYEMSKKMKLDHYSIEQQPIEIKEESIIPDNDKEEDTKMDDEEEEEDEMMESEDHVYREISLEEYKTTAPTVAVWYTLFNFFHKLEPLYHDQNGVGRAFYTSIVDAVLKFFLPIMRLEDYPMMVGSREVYEVMAELFDGLCKASNHKPLELNSFEWLVEEINKNSQTKYTQVTGLVVSEMLNVYNFVGQFKKPPSQANLSFFLVKNIGEPINPIYDYIKEEVRKSSDRLSQTEADRYTEFLIDLFSNPGHEEAGHKFRNSIEAEINFGVLAEFDEDLWNSISRPGPVKESIEILINFRIELFVKMTINLFNSHILRAMKDLQFLTKKSNLFVSKEVLNIIGIAEARRRAEGHRFISKRHLRWALCSCYDLSLKIKIDEESFQSASDCPPYQIYLTALAFTESLGLGVLEVEQLAVAVFYSQNFTIDSIPDMLSNFRKLAEEFQPDGVKKAPKLYLNAILCEPEYYFDY